MALYSVKNNQLAWLGLMRIKSIDVSMLAIGHDNKKGCRME